MTRSPLEPGQPAPVANPALARAEKMSRALAEAARRARFSTRSRNLMGGGFGARRGARVFQMLFWASFLALVLAPTLAAAVYYGVFASSQYVSEGQFTVTGGEIRAADDFGATLGIPAAAIIQDTQIVTNYVESRAAVDRLDQSIGLRSLYARPEIDAIARLSADASMEEFLRYWRKMVAISIQMPSGIVEFKVRAFTSDDAARIGAAIIDMSEKLINEINERMQRDVVAETEKEFQRAADRLATARLALEKARNDEGVLDAAHAAEALGKLVVEARGALMAQQQEYQAQLRAVSSSAPQMRALKSRIDAARAQIAELEGQITATATSDGKTLSSSMTRFSELDLERQIAERIYAGAAAAVELARMAAERKMMYVNTFVRPIPPQEALYPKRLQSTALLAFAALAGWGVIIGLAAAARNNMG